MLLGRIPDGYCGLKRHRSFVPDRRKRADSRASMYSVGLGPSDVPVITKLRDGKESVELAIRVGSLFRFPVALQRAGTGTGACRMRHAPVYAGRKNMPIGVLRCRFRRSLTLSARHS